MNAVFAITLAVLMSYPTEPYYTTRRGADGPSGFVWRSHDYLILQVPDLNFKKELEALVGSEVDEVPQVSGNSVSSETAELRDAEDALAADGIEGDARLEALDALAAARDALPPLDDYELDLWNWDGPKHCALTEETAQPDPEIPSIDFAPFESMVAHLPGEFLLYLKGAAAYRQGKFREAIRHWDMLLKYPANARVYKSTWSAFMIGKAWLHLDTKRAIPWFEKTRGLVDGGFRDPLGLYGESLGWQAFAEMQTDDPAAAIRHYAEQFKTGKREDHTSAFNSFHYAIRAVFKDGNPPDAVLKDPLVREIVTLAILSGRGPERSPRTWAVNLETRLPETAKMMAGWMAVLYYKDREYANASVWAGRAPENDFYAQWVKTKLNYRGRYFDAEDNEIERLLNLYRALLKSGDSRALRYPDIEFALSNELGVVQLNHGSYIPAFRAFLNGHNVEDAAYIAECILTHDELAGLMSNLPEIVDIPTENYGWAEPVSPGELLSGILAGKLAREGRYKDAEVVVPARSYNEYESAITRGRDESIQKRGRAESLFLAARIAREQGMDLFGTRFAPDWSRYNGQRIPSGTDRLEEGVARPAEALRISSNRPFPNRRFHYKWNAADLMWECAQLLPNNDELLAQALWYGGTYIASEDPKGADKFYKALVRRCGSLPIGKDAEKRRWFPPKPVEWTYPSDRAWG